MNLSAEALEFLSEKGLSIADAARLARLMDIAPPKSRKAANQAAYRERQKQLNGNGSGNESGNALPVTVTGNAPPIEDFIPPVPLAKANGAEAEIETSPETVLWNSGKAFLMRHGVTKTKAGEMLGKWKREHGIALTVEALSAAEQESRNKGGLVDPLAFIAGALKHRTAAEAPIC